MEENIIKILDDLISRYPELDTAYDNIWNAYKILEESYSSGGKLLVAGNGGSAADSEHIVGELMKGFVKPRKLEKEACDRLKSIDEKLGTVLSDNLQGALPSIAVTGHVGLSTAYLNDFHLPSRSMDSEEREMYFLVYLLQEILKIYFMHWLQPKPRV